MLLHCIMGSQVTYADIFTNPTGTIRIIGVALSGIIYSAYQARMWCNFS